MIKPNLFMQNMRAEIQALENDKVEDGSNLDKLIRPDASEGGNQTQISVEDLANLDTDAIKELRDRSEMLLARGDKYVMESETDFKTLLDTVDAAMESDSRLGVFDLSQVRNYVKSIMITLRQNPAYKGILLDRDVHNIVRFARDSIAAAVEMTAVRDVVASSGGRRKTTSAQKLQNESVMAKVAAEMNELDLSALLKGL